MLLTLRVRGRCRLLRFEPAQAHYRCGLMPATSGAAWPRRALRALVARWIGAGLGCDSSAEAIAEPRVDAVDRPH